MRLWPSWITVQEIQKDLVMLTRYRWWKATDAALDSVVHTPHEDMFRWFNSGRIVDYYKDHNCLKALRRWRKNMIERAEQEQEEEANRKHKEEMKRVFRPIDELPSLPMAKVIKDKKA
jgi:hypothetical protein